MIQKGNTLNVKKRQRVKRARSTTTTTTTTLLNQIIIVNGLVNGWPTPQIAIKKANRGEASQIQEHTY